MASRSITAALVHKTRESDFGKNDTISMRSSSSNAIKTFALSLALITRLKGTRKWPIDGSQELVVKLRFPQFCALLDDLNHYYPLADTAEPLVLLCGPKRLSPWTTQTKPTE